ncbi:MAG TPA: YebC/PmpR family DNA-binding transcriptional regulator, partial [Syntrophales bacterium]|nr:YebC/PmpR family DNA-binding transcriptional regulator [Syntrophales bacterium]
VLVECLTDNKNRTASEVRTIFNKNNGSMGGEGSVAWMFEKKGNIIVSKDTIDEDSLMELALEAGAEDVVEQESEYEVITGLSTFEDVRSALDDAKIEYILAEIGMIPQNTVELEEDKAGQMLRLMEKMEDNDDVQHVYANFDISDELMEKLS